MTVLNPNNVRVVDPILSTHARGYRHPERIGHLLFPRVPVSVSAGWVLTFGKESFRLYNTRRAPGGATKRIETGYAGAKFSLTQDSLEGKVPREWLREAAAVPGIDLGRRAVTTVQNVMGLTLEVEQAVLATTAANYDASHKITLAGATKWSADTGTPLTDVSNAREAVRASIGMEPNTMVLSPAAWTAAKANPSVVERFKFTTNEPITLEMFAKLVEIEHVAVGKAIVADDDDVFSDVWGNACVLAYVPENSQGQEEPSYGYTYTLDNNPLVEVPYYDNNAKSWIYGVTDERAPVLCGMAAGFLIEDPA